MTALLHQIEQDARYTADLRIELTQMLKYVPSSRFKTKEQYVTDFISSIVMYLDVPNSNTPATIRQFRDTDGNTVTLAGNTPIIGRNIMRSKVISKLSSMIDVPGENSTTGDTSIEKKKEEKRIIRSDTISSLPSKTLDSREPARTVLDETIDLLQKRYQQVADAFYFLRKELLT